jgi:hypothetical protein
LSGREKKRSEGGELRIWVRNYHGNLGGFWGKSDSSEPYDLFSIFIRFILKIPRQVLKAKFTCQENTRNFISA